VLEFLFEVVFQVVFEVIAEGLLEAGYKRTARVLRSPAVRYGLGAAVGFGFGVWWGDRLSGGHRPSLFWISLAVAAVSGAAALRRASEMKRPDPAGALDTLRGLADRPADADRFSWRAVVDPRRWPVQRFVGLAVLNGAVAAGIAVGFNPLP
jgi:hypothetical protein